MVDVLIIGAGAAGLSAAITAHDAGATVRILAKAKTDSTASYQTQGGIAAALNNAGDGDTATLHVEDTLASGKGLSDPEPVTILCREAIDRIRELDAWGCQFDRDAEGHIAQRPYGGHRRIRACFAGDQTGIPVMQTLKAQVLQRGIPFSQDFFVADLWRQNQTCLGVIAWHEPTRTLQKIPAAAVIIATGGIGQVFAVTSNPLAATGDGLHLAASLGGRLRDMEFIQFHPTGLYPSGHLISEACRAEGGYLINAAGKRFMFDYDPRGELATRDIVARAIFTEIQAGRGIKGQPFVGLDIRHLGAEMIAAKLPLAQKTAQLEAGIDVTEQMIPVAPTQHYTMGGISTSVNGEILDAAGEVIPRVYAAGEVACLSVHGANRLGCNSLVECLVFGQRAGRHAADWAGHYEGIPTEGRASVTLYGGSSADAAGARRELQMLMSRACGVEREPETLRAAEQQLGEEMRRLFVTVEEGDISPELANSLRHGVELHHLYNTALAITTAALKRPQSVGAHFRMDA